MSGSCPCEAKASSKEGAGNKEEGVEISGSGEFGILNAQ